MAISYTYIVQRMDGTECKTFKNQGKAETYARRIKRSDAEKVQITRTAKGYEPYVYYI